MPTAYNSAPRVMDYVLNRGDSGEWSVSDADFAPGANGAAAVLEFNTPGEVVSVSGAPDGDAWKITLSADVAQRIPAGRFGYRILLTADGGKQKTIDAGQVYIFDPTAINDDEELLRLLENIYRQKAAGRGDINGYTVGSTAYSTMSLMEIRREINACKERINRAASGGFRHRPFAGGGAAAVPRRFY